MKTMLKLSLASALGFGLLASAMPANATDQTGNASAEIQEQLTITEDTAMDFATIAADPTGDTVTLTAADAISSTGTSTFSGTPSAGEFTATGTPNASVTISFSTGDTLTGPGAAMGLGTFTTDAGGTPALDGTGELTFNVGANLGVNAGQVGGTYTGTYTVTVDY